MTEHNGFLQAPNGDLSSARLMFMIGLFYSMTMTSLGLFTLAWSSGEAIAFFSAVSAVFVALKLGQKPMEEKSKPDPGFYTPEKETPIAKE